MKTLDAAFLAALGAEALERARLRTNHNVHPRSSDPVQRFLNAMEPGSYVRPHRHDRDDGWELFVALRGRAVALTFDREGTVLERVELAPDGVFLVEIGARVWHTVAALVSGTVLFELKPGPYVAPSDKDFAAWAPLEQDPRAAALGAWYLQARAGEPAPR